MDQIFFNTAEIERTHDYRKSRRDLLAKVMTEYLGVHTDQIVAILNKDPNTAPYKLMTEYLQQEIIRSVIWVEDMHEQHYLCLHMINEDGQEAGMLDVSTSKTDPTSEKITSETYEELKALSIDIDVAKADAETKIEDTI
ncbi:MAG TPA: hypothetical protein PKW94_02615 [Candidatus Dojkabacteria bacterium]|nr:hypothetical protein [Candidatus Dojkabacteria bacterium]